MSNRENYDVIVGLELHVQTKTKSKIFCSCNADYFNKGPNVFVCPVCLGLPGALPVPNKRAIELCILMGLVTNCKIDREIHFDRKHYFYPDLPKGYQISQCKRPICYDGYIKLPNGKKVEIERIHQEEDVAKSTHHVEELTNKAYTLVDYNKSGVSLIEIVTKPCIHNAKDAKDYCTKIRQLARYLNVSDADMEKGQMRCEPNISVQKKGTWEQKDGKIVPIGNAKLNPKVEVKNIGSITAVEKAIEYEIDRLIGKIEKGEELKQETRGWNADKGITEFQRSKESADDYRYMPEPDIPIIDISEKDIERISKELVELPDEKVKRYMEDWKLTKYSAEVISASRNNAEYFEKLQKVLSETMSEEEAAKEAANWLIGTVYAIANKLGREPHLLKIPHEDLALVILAYKEKMFTKSVAEEILIEKVKRKINIKNRLNLLKEEQQNSSSNIENIIDEVIKNNQKAVDDYKAGKGASIGFLVGQVMQATKGTANPTETKNILEKKLK